MLYLILILVFGAVGTGFYFLYQPAQAAMQKNVFRQKEHVAHELEEMFIFISVDSLQKIKWSLSMVVAGVGLILTWEAKPPAPLIAAALLGIIAYWGPELFIIYLRKKRRAAFSQQLVDGLVLMSNGLRSGFTLQQAIDMLIEEMPAPISQEFELVRREFKLGVDLDVALRNCVNRTKDEDLDLVVTAIQITRQLGGNLAEVFDRIVAMVRERKILAGKADALTSEGKLQALVVGLLPYGFLFAMIKVNPDMMRIMWTTFPGFIALLLVIILDTVGYLWVRKVANVEY
ncbi:MAG: type II secretion system F family protein [Verrucomicrobiae bacterium]|nr:type II secretion system F family protein [Verrucomicrobiae bacterium]